MFLARNLVGYNPMATHRLTLFSDLQFKTPCYLLALVEAKLYFIMIKFVKLSAIQNNILSDSIVYLLTMHPVRYRHRVKSQRHQSCYSKL